MTKKEIETLCGDLYEAECLLNDRVPKRWRGKALNAVKEAKRILIELVPAEPKMVELTDDVTRAKNKMLFCGKCGWPISGDFCQKCGTKVLKDECTGEDIPDHQKRP